MTMNASRKIEWDHRLITGEGFLNVAAVYTTA